VDPKHCAICDISDVQFVFKGALVPIRYIKKGSLYFAHAIQRLIAEIMLIFLFVWEFVFCMEVIFTLQIVCEVILF